MSDGFNVSIEDVSGCDILSGAGLARSGHVPEQRVVRVIADLDAHPSVRASDVLVLQVRDNRAPHARLTVSALYAADLDEAKPPGS